VDGSSIAVLGKDPDSVFYGLESLDSIFSQTENVIAGLTIMDYADSELRGFIEGYYGIPWTSDERISLMNPCRQSQRQHLHQDDSYHSSNWRGLYKPADLAELQRQIVAGKSNKVRFSWSIHPFLSNPITSANYAEGLNAVKAKFGQLYEAGVRQFVISADDVEASLDHPVDGNLHKNLLNDMEAWCEEKGDCYDLIFVPSAYCYQSSQRLKVDPNIYFGSLISGLNEKVQIMWTGEDVCSSIQTLRATEFTSWTNRKPFMWLNWPVNDYSTTHLLMGKGEVLNETFAEGTTPTFSGIVTNPMQQAEESKLSIFAVACYSWNIQGFDRDRSYADSFRFLDEGDPEDLKEICSHLTNATLYEGSYFEEAEDLKPLVADFTAAYEALLPTAEAANKIIENLLVTVEACENYLLKAKNLALLSSMKPWIESLRDLAQATVLFLQIEAGAGTLDVNAEKTLFDQAESLMEGRKNYAAPVLNKITYNPTPEVVEVAVSVLSPFAHTIQAIAKDEYFIKSGQSTGVTYRGFSGIYSGTLDNITDKDESSFVWFASAPSANAYVRVDYGAITKISDIKVLQGNASNGDCMNGVIEYSLDGKNYTSLATLDGALTALDIRNAPIQARFLRLRNTGTETWVAIKEIEINVLPSVSGTVSVSNIALEPSVVTSLCNMVDGDETTFTWFEINKNENASIVLDLRESRTISHITFLQAKPSSLFDYFYHLTFSVSNDGLTYETLQSFDDTKEISFDLASPSSVRYVKAQSTASSPYGVVVREFAVS
jgi:beta-N-acetylglucosaminidase./F5/8 type C domain.